MNRPHHNSYWVVPGKFLATEYPGHKAADDMRTRLRAFLACGVTEFVDLTEVGENGLRPYAAALAEEAQAVGREISHCRFPVRDLDVPNAATMRTILDHMDAALAAGRVVAVHCWGGVGRTGTVVGCWLVRHGMSGDAALQQIGQWWQTMEKKHRRPRSPETSAQRDFVRHWHERPDQPKAANDIAKRHAGSPKPKRKPTAAAATSADQPDVLAKRRQFCRATLLGLAVGDAVGTTLEFKSPGSFWPLTDMVGGGPFGLKAGQWTDDTSMALCLAASLAERGQFDAADQMRRYVRWWREGYFSSTGRCFDIGNTTRAALSRFEKTGDAYAGSTDPHTAGNGSLMRLAPVPLFFLNQPAEAIARAAESSRTTHAAPTAVDACRYFAGLLVGAWRGESKATLLSPHYSPMETGWKKSPLHPEIAAIAEGSFKRRQPPAIRGAGFVVPSLEAALWAFHTTDNFRAGCLAAANLGDDADTTAAIYGQLAGAYYGESAIPAEWLAKLALRKEIVELAESLAAVAHQRSTGEFPT